MLTEEFNKIVEQRIAKIKETLIEKTKEYATADDRLHNFNKGEQISGKPREIVLWGFALKHYISFMDILDNIEKGILPTEKLIDEKIGDLINYLILEEACIKDKINKEF